VPGEGGSPIGTDPSWRTPAERSEYRTTPDLAETVAYLERLVAAHPDRLRMESFGTSGEGRDMKLVIASNDGTFEPAAPHAAGRAVVLVQNSIHSGEMDGKDASLALLRDLVEDPACSTLLDRVVLLVIPVYNVDGHERRSAFGRINQNGPEEFGWRANGSNLNLNRDYLKADAPETRAFLRMFHRWLPDFFVDSHVTDGADFQYDVTFLIDTTPDVVPATADWIRTSVTPELVRRVDATGHLAFPGPVFLRDDTDPSQGLIFFPNPPRFSTGQMILEGRPGLLVELHMLKDYRTRVTGNYAILRALLEVVSREADTLRSLNRAADAAAAALGGRATRSVPFPLAIGPSGRSTPVEFRGRHFSRTESAVSGAVRIEYDGEPWNRTLPVDTGSVTASVPLPVGYIVPRPWSRVIDVLEAHGVPFERTTSDWTGTVERYRCAGMHWQGPPFEGRHPLFAAEGAGNDPGRFGSCVRSTEPMRFAAGSAVFLLDHRLARVVVHWLEPEAPDSALRWGFFDSIFEQKEHGEAYVLERLAREELARNPGLRTEFEERVRSDAAFAGSPAARLEFFYDRSLWARANRVGEYPVARLLTLEGLPISRSERPEISAGTESRSPQGVNTVP
jgi:Zinc carboxypeptidase